MYLTYRVGKVRREVSTETQKSLAEMTAMTEETLSVSGMLLSKTFGQQANSIDQVPGAQRQAGRAPDPPGDGRPLVLHDHRHDLHRSRRRSCTGWPATLAIQGDPTAPTIGDIVAFTTLQSRLFFPLGQLLNVQVEIQGALALFDRIFEYLEMDPEIVDAPDAVALEPTRPSAARSASATCRFRYPTEAVPSPRGPRARRAREDGARASEHGRGHRARRRCSRR